MAWGRRNKFNAVKTEVDGILFDSKHESRVYLMLKSRALSGEISDLKFQQRFDLNINGLPWCYMKPDFTYIENGVKVAHEAKGRPTADWKLKMKAFKILYTDWEYRITYA